MVLRLGSAAAGVEVGVGIGARAQWRALPLGRPAVVLLQAPLSVLVGLVLVVLLQA